MRSSYVSVSRLLSVALGVIVTTGNPAKATEPKPSPEVVAATAEADPAAPAPTGPTAVATETAQPTKKKEPSPWRGSEIAYRNSATAYSFDKGAQLTYNPTWVMTWELSPRYSFDKVLSVGATFDFAREVTNADDNTYRNETVIGDLGLRLSASKWATIPGGIDVSSTLALTLPTSKSSQGDTLLMGLAASTRLAKTFPVLDGLTLGYTLRFTKLFHSYTTGELESPIIPNCFAGSSGSCDRFINNGGRNVSFRLANTFDLSLDINDWLSFSTDFGIGVSWLYDAQSDDRVSFEPLENTDTRYSLVADLGFSARPWQPLEIRVGASAANPQLKSNGDRYAPYFNRFTEVYLDLRLDVAGLVSELVAQED